jgi:hypothetical protein
MFLSEGKARVDGFSKRHGFAPEEPEIAIREDAPYELRGVVADIAYESGLGPHGLRGIVCRVLRTREDPSNWSPFPNVDDEARGHLDSCEWFEVYDIIEAIHANLVAAKARDPFRESGADPEKFERELNDYMRKRGIGWQLKNGRIETRGQEAFEHAVVQARTELVADNRSTAAQEIHEALRDLSRRPEPDITGSIQHALAALECVARGVTGDPKATLGTILGRNPDLLARPLDAAVEKLWGFASEQGRHLREGRQPPREEAELAVHVAAAAAAYLSRKARTSLRALD